MPTPEGKIEDYLLEQCRNNNILCWKFTSPSQNGVPDRILLYKGHTIFVELKAPGEKPRKDQVSVHNIMRNHGAEVYTADSEHMCDTIVANLLKRKKRKTHNINFKTTLSKE